MFRTVEAAGLFGLNSADFIVRDEAVDCLEINPRPGATLDVFADDEGALFRLHLKGCGGTISSEPLTLAPASAAMVVYAAMDMVVRRGIAWPRWASDRPAGGASVSRGAPLCTVLANAGDADAAEVLVRRRAEEIKDMVTE